MLFFNGGKILTAILTVISLFTLIFALPTKSSNSDASALQARQDAGSIRPYCPVSGDPHQCTFAYIAYRDFADRQAWVFNNNCDPIGSKYFQAGGWTSMYSALPWTVDILTSPQVYWEPPQVFKYAGQYYQKDSPNWNCQYYQGNSQFWCLHTFGC